MGIFRVLKFSWNIYMPGTDPRVEQGTLALGSWPLCSNKEQLEKSLLLTGEQLKVFIKNTLPSRIFVWKSGLPAIISVPSRSTSWNFLFHPFSKNMEPDFIAAMYRPGKYSDFSDRGDLLCFLASSLVRKDWFMIGPFAQKGENPTKSIHFYRRTHCSGSVIWKENF